MFFLEILANYFLPIIYDSFVALVLALIFLTIFRIRDPSIRILFFFLPIIKPFIIILERIDVDKIYLQSYQSALGFRFPDPTSIIKFDEGSWEASVIGSNTNILIVLMGLKWENTQVTGKK